LKQFAFLQGFQNNPYGGDKAKIHTRQRVFCCYKLMGPEKILKAL